MVQIDMDMPKTCRDCPFWEGGYGCFVVEHIPAWQKDIAENGKNKRSEHCPLIEVKTNYYDSFDICKSCSNKFGCNDGSNLSAKKCWFRKKSKKENNNEEKISG